jgi:hypothetical protein
MQQLIKKIIAHGFFPPTLAGEGWGEGKKGCWQLFVVNYPLRTWPWPAGNRSSQRGMFARQRKNAFYLSQRFFAGRRAFCSQSSDRRLAHNLTDPRPKS